MRVLYLVFITTVALLALLLAAAPALRAQEPQPAMVGMPEYGVSLGGTPEHPVIENHSGRVIIGYNIETADANGRIVRGCPIRSKWVVGVWQKPFGVNPDSQDCDPQKCIPKFPVAHGGQSYHGGRLGLPWQNITFAIAKSSTSNSFRCVTDSGLLKKRNCSGSGGPHGICVRRGRTSAKSRVRRS